MWAWIGIGLTAVVMTVNSLYIYHSVKNKKDLVYRADFIKLVDELDEPLYIADPVTNIIRYANKPFLDLLGFDEFFDINGYDENKILTGGRNNKEKDFTEAILNSDMVFKTKYIFMTKGLEQINADVVLSGVDFNCKRHIIKIIKKI